MVGFPSLQPPPERMFIGRIRIEQYGTVESFVDLEFIAWGDLSQGKKSAKNTARNPYCLNNLLIFTENHRLWKIC